jgi:signal transduction histidine kinase
MAGSDHTTGGVSPQFSKLADYGINSLIEVSLDVEETGTTGYILLRAISELSFTTRELRMLVQVAGQVSPAIQNATAQEQAVALAEARTSEAKAEARSLELERINDAKSRFLSIVSHELRTPLTSISAYAELPVRNSGG